MSKILKLPAVVESTGLSRSSIYAFIAVKKFPPPVPLGVRAVGWLESEIAEWIQKQAEQRGTKI